MKLQDLFVGGIVAALGMTMVAGAVQGATWLLERRGARTLVGAFGKPTARAILAVAGVALIALGTAIALGWRLNWL
jgi:hypothetical protein